MKKTADFASRDIDGWPRPADIEPYFLAPPGGWFSRTREDTAGFAIEGVDGTEHLPPNKGRTNITLYLSAHPTLGVLLTWAKVNNRECQDYHSKGDLRRLRELVFSRRGDPLPVGLFVPYEVAWKAVKEFLETDGRLPTSIEWVDDLDLPPDTFPDPANESWPQRFG